MRRKVFVCGEKSLRASTLVLSFQLERGVRNVFWSITPPNRPSFGNGSDSKVKKRVFCENSTSASWEVMKARKGTQEEGKGEKAKGRGGKKSNGGQGRGREGKEKNKTRREEAEGEASEGKKGTRRKGREVSV